MEAFQCTCTLKIQMESAEHAHFVASSLQVDEELQPLKGKKSFSVEHNVLVVDLYAVDEKTLRIGVCSVTDMLSVALRTLLEFG